MTLRVATPDDADTLAALHRTCFANGWSADAFARLFASPGTFALLSADGFILARAAGGEAEILSLGVAPASRRGGQGRALVVSASCHAHDSGATELFLEVAADNAAARALYAGLGFREAGLRKGYYRENGTPPRDALTLRAELPLRGLGNAPELD